MTFNIGQRVICIALMQNRFEAVNKVGTVIDITHNGRLIGVEFDEYINGHDCGGKCKNGYGWRFYPAFLKPYYDPLKAKNRPTISSTIV